MPGITLTTDVIVGFCGETEAQFENTLELLREVRFETVFAAAFSVRPGTPAARLEDDVPRVEKKRRLQALLDLQEGIGLAANERGWAHDRGAGRSAAAAVEPRGWRRRRHVRLAGRNRNNKLVHFDGAPELIGRLVNVRVDHARAVLHWRLRSTGDPTAIAALPPLIVIAGATATGKTGLSLALAEAIPGAEIISADSRQVYRGMDIGTAKVTAAERALVPHHGLDLVDPDEPFTAADYQRAADDALRADRGAGRGGAAGRRHRAVSARGGTRLAARRDRP